MNFWYIIRSTSLELWICHLLLPDTLGISQITLVAVACYGSCAPVPVTTFHFDNNRQEEKMQGVKQAHTSNHGWQWRKVHRWKPERHKFTGPAGQGWHHEQIVFTAHG